MLFQHYSSYLAATSVLFLFFLEFSFIISSPLFIIPSTIYHTFPIDDSHCDKIPSSLTAVHCFDDGYVEKQPVAWKEYCAEYWLKELQESMDRCTGRQDVTEILLKTALNSVQSIN